MEENKMKSAFANWRNARFATRNVHGGMKDKDEAKQRFCEDMRKLNITVAAIQETYTEEETYINIEGDTIISMGKGTSNNEYHYGQGFYLSKEATARKEGYKRVSNRLSYLRLYASISENGKKNIITFINVYAPTAMKTRQMPAETENFYEQLKALYAEQKATSTLVFVMGDFNGKIGQRRSDEESVFMGKFGKGTRNQNGHYVANMALENNLYISNTAFYHPLSKRATWRGYIHGNRYCNQIDYIMVPDLIKKGLRQSRTHHYYLRSLRYESDHGMVVTTIDMSAYYNAVKKINRVKEINIDLELIRQETEKRRMYQRVLQEELQKAVELNNGM